MSAVFEAQNRPALCSLLQGPHGHLQACSYTAGRIVPCIPTVSSAGMQLSPKQALGPCKAPQHSSSRSATFCSPFSHRNTYKLPYFIANIQGSSEEFSRLLGCSTTLLLQLLCGTANSETALFMFTGQPVSRLERRCI